ncbi:MAG: hypothetical protein EHM43_11585, partial [Ignavibacteriae bacterium]
MNRFLRSTAGIALSVMCLLAGLSQTATSQIYYVLGHNGATGGGYTTAAATSYLNPLDDWYWTERCQYVIRATDMTQIGVSPGLIESFSFFITANTASFASREITIRLRTTTNVNATSPMNTTNFTTVFNQTGWSIPPYGSMPEAQTVVNGQTGKWYQFKFQTPFMWNGTSNLEYEICTYRGGYTTIGPTVQIAIQGQGGGSYFPMSYYYNDGANYCNTSVGYGTVNARPTMRI